MTRTADLLAERPVTRAYRPIGPRCPTHRDEVMAGGPTQYHCPAGDRDGHRVQAADLNREVTR